MKLYTGPMAAPHTPELFDALCKLLLRPDGPELAIETGTFLGQGTTKLLIDAVIASGVKAPPFAIYTFEANLNFYLQAQANLVPWSEWVYPIFGLTVRRAEAIRAMEGDPLLNGQEDYPEIYKDTEGDLVEFYTREISPPHVPIGIPEDGLINLMLRFRRGKRVLFVLDSAGGLGWREFDLVKNWMEANPFFLWLDDINHLKHYRSWCHIQDNEDGAWHVLYTDDRTVLASHGVKP